MKSNIRRVGCSGKKSKMSDSCYQTIIEHAVDPIVITNDEGGIELLNRAASDLFGYKSDLIIGNHISILLPEKQHHNFQYFFNQAEQDSIVGRIKEFTALRSDGNIFPVSLSLSRIKLPDQLHVYYVAIRDTTEDKKLQIELSRAHKLEAVGQLAAGIAHEINTPIQFVNDNTNFLKDAFVEINEYLNKLNKLIADYVSEDSDCRDKVKEIYDEADLEFLLSEIPDCVSQTLEGVEHIREIVKAMKEFSHPGSATMDMADMNHTISSTITVAKNEWKYIADVETEFGDLPMVPLYIGEFNQVLLNIIVNAAHAIEERYSDGQVKGNIFIRTYRDEYFAVVEIKDDGCGIDQANIEKIYDPFFTTKEVGKGTGQGLSIAYKVIVERHNGQLEVKSERGKGTIFRIILPVDNKQDPSPVAVSEGEIDLF